MKWLWLLPLAAIVAGLYWVQQLRSAPPEVPFTKVTRERLVSTLTTNGKVEPFEWTVVRAGREGLLANLNVEKGQILAAGAVVAEIESAEARTELAAAETRIAQARAELDVLRGGGRSRDLAEIDASISKLKVELDGAARELETLRRLIEKKAATQLEADQIQQRIDRTTAEVRGLEKQRAALVSQPDRNAAEARLRDAEIAAEAARRRLTQGVVRTSLGGTVYQIDARKGAYVRPGDAIVSVGRLDRVRVLVYVDEPELGNVRIGQKVTIRWDAMPGKEWSGLVERLPSQIVPLGSRQVGEVVCIIENEQRLLIPNTNVNAEILLNVAEGAITIPKEALRRENTQTGVFLLQGDRIEWRNVVLGAASLTRLQVTQGLQEGDAVALPTDVALQTGMPVQPKFEQR